MASESPPVPRASFRLHVNWDSARRPCASGEDGRRCSRNACGPRSVSAIIPIMPSHFEIANNALRTARANYVNRAINELYRATPEKTPAHECSLARMKYYVGGIALTMFLALSQSQALADDCSQFRLHIDSAKRAFVDAEVYRQEDDSSLAKVSYKVAVHELDLAERYGKPNKCLPMKSYNEYFAVVFKRMVWRYSYPDYYTPATAAAESLSTMHDILKSSQPYGGKEAYESMKRSYRDMQIVVQAYTAADKDMANAGIDPPTVSAPHKPGCADTSAHVISAVPPKTPVVAQQQGITGEVQVRVEIDKLGAVLSVGIQKSASPLLNDAALESARNSAYAPQVVNCKPVGGAYIFIVDFEQTIPVPTPTH